MPSFSSASIVNFNHVFASWFSERIEKWLCGEQQEIIPDMQIHELDRNYKINIVFMLLTLDVILPLGEAHLWTL